MTAAERQRYRRQRLAAEAAPVALGILYQVGLQRARQVYTELGKLIRQAEREAAGRL
jgi:hypothetical protein